MRLPDGLEQQLQHEIHTIEQDKQVQYITSIEKMGMAKGLEQGLEQGVQLGEAKLLKKFLELRFGTLPAWVLEQLANSNGVQMEQWLIKANSAIDLDSVFDDVKH